MSDQPSAQQPFPEQPTPEESSPEQPREIVARGSKDYRVRRYIMVLLIMGMGGWFLYDGFVKYPRENEEAIAAGNTPPHSDTDLFLQKALGIALPPLGLLMLAWTLYNSRGTCRLSGDTLRIPGHPMLTLDDIVRLDRTRWNRKGVAFVDYEAEGKIGRLKLDDFVYEREPTDEIFEHIEQHVIAATGEESEVEPEDQSEEAPEDDKRA